MNLVGRLYPYFLCAGSLLVLGCNPPAPPPPAGQTTVPSHDHDHDGDHDHADHEEHHESYADAVAELDTLRLAVKDALAEGNMEKADDPVHEIGHVLEELPELAAKDADLAADDTIKPAIDDLFDCFDQIDRKLHGGAGKTYDEVAERVDAAMKTLRSKAKAEEK